MGQLIWQVAVTAGNELKLWFTVAGSHTGRTGAYMSGPAALQQPDWLLHEKLAEREALLACSKSVPNATLQVAFDWAKLNLADMRRVITDAKIRDTQDGTLQGKIYPPLLETCALPSGFGAGYPDYPWYFGTDGAYTVFPLVAAGQFQAARDQLRLLRKVSRTVNGSTGTHHLLQVRAPA